MIPLIENSRSYAFHTAIASSSGTYSYARLYEQACTIARTIAARRIHGQPVVYMLASGFEHVCVQWGIWLSGNIAVPIHTGHPLAEVKHIVEDSGAGLFLTTEEYAEQAGQACDETVHLLLYKDATSRVEPVPLPEVELTDDALMIYTSGTTGKPKGVVMSHRQIDTQVRSLTEAWEWKQSDRILNVLPMHHVHGIINITCCALYNGAYLEMHTSFDPAATAARLGSGELTLFMAVPTIYHKLIQYYKSLDPDRQLSWKEGLNSIRLMVSGSAALPAPVLDEWQQISGHLLLERYGMTEIGMALSNPLHGNRKPGYVGKPLPYIEAKIVDDEGGTVLHPYTPGELYVKGPTVFRYYWGRAGETEKSFDGKWFKTGDIVERDEEGNYRILGRSSTDIIKSGGYKISALEIENVLLSHAGVLECAIVALPDVEWGERIAVAYTGTAQEQDLKEWLRSRLAAYKLPRAWLQLASLPRNAMGKVLKTEIKKSFQI
jgi:malonyl-CoA/methylmalonyl-CoA synthetase